MSFFPFVTKKNPIISASSLSLLPFLGKPRTKRFQISSSEICISVLLSVESLSAAFFSPSFFSGKNEKCVFTTFFLGGGGNWVRRYYFFAPLLRWLSRFFHSRIWEMQGLYFIFISAGRREGEGEINFTKWQFKTQAGKVGRITFFHLSLIPVFYEFVT